MTAGPVFDFTERENQVGDGIRRGLSYAEIAGELTRILKLTRPMSVHTVRSHVRNMASKLDDPPELPPRWRIFLHFKVEREIALRMAAKPHAHNGKGPQSRAD